MAQNPDEPGSKPQFPQKFPRHTWLHHRIQPVACGHYLSIINNGYVADLVPKNGTSVTIKKKTKFSQGLGQLLRDLRKQHGLTQIELASKLAINYRHYQDIEAGRTDVRIGTVNHIVSLYNVDLILLMETATAPEGWKNALNGVNAAPVGFAETNREGIVKFANKTCHTQLGYEFPKLVGRPISDMVANSYRSSMQSWYRHLIDSQPPPKIKKIQMRHRDGDDIFLNMSWSYIRGVDEVLVGVASVFYDVDMPD